jgi:tetratricopeptide (TPR) repeat protein
MTSALVSVLQSSAPTTAKTPAQNSIRDTADAASLNQQVLQLYNQGRYSEAIPLAQRALTIREKALSSDHPDVAQALNNLAELYRAQGHYADAEPLYKRALATWEKALGPDHPNFATSLNNLANLYDKLGRYGDAEPLYKRSLAIREKALGPDHPDVGVSSISCDGLPRTGSL